MTLLSDFSITCAMPNLNALKTESTNTKISGVIALLDKVGIYRWDLTSTLSGDDDKIVVPNSAPASGRWIRMTGSDINSQGSYVGEIRPTVSTYAPDNWLLLDDSTIGDIGSTATRKNSDYQNLFILLWNSISDTYCPVAGGRGTSASADWIANKSITLPRTLGRVFGNSGNALTGSGLTAYNLGQYVGNETVSAGGGSSEVSLKYTYISARSGTIPALVASYYSTPFTTTYAITSAVTSGGGGSNIQPSIFLNWIIRYKV